MHGVLSFVERLGIDLVNVAFLPVRLLAPEYELLTGRVYPLRFCDEKRDSHVGMLCVDANTAEIVVCEKETGTRAARE
eukprot:502434-Rhodomonas_salina.1